MSDIQENPSQDPELDKDVSFELPASVKRIISIPALIIVLSIIGLYIYLIFWNPKHIDPEKYGLPVILISLILTLIFVNLPWNKLGFRVKKIGMIELENVVKGQAQNNSKELADLQRQIDDLKLKISGNINESSTYNEADDLIIEFLKTYSKWAFSALRIKKWGAKQTGFERLDDYETEEIRESLRRLLSKKQVVTGISKKGNTLYRIK